MPKSDTKAHKEVDLNTDWKVNGLGEPKVRLDSHFEEHQRHTALLSNTSSRHQGTTTSDLKDMHYALKQGKHHSKQVREPIISWKVWKPDKKTVCKIQLLKGMHKLNFPRALIQHITFRLFEY